MIPAGASITLGILAACAGLLLATFLLALCRAAAPRTLEERQREDEEQAAALRRIEPTGSMLEEHA